MRLNKYLAHCGIASRRKCDEYIKKGKVKVNGTVVTDFAYQVNGDDDCVTIDGQTISLIDKNVYYILNKPKGVISASSSARGEITAVDLIKNESKRLYPVGRLDKDSQGLIILTDDGDFTYKATHPKFQNKKRYIVKVKGVVDKNKLERLKQGIFIDGKMTSRAEVKLISDSKTISTLDITIKEGRNRQIRKMCDAVGLYVTELKRIEECGIKLGSLKSGEYRKLTDNEIKKLLDVKRGQD